jgi:hypothetical protein
LQCRYKLYRAQFKNNEYAHYSIDETTKQRNRNLTVGLLRQHVHATIGATDSKQPDIAAISADFRKGRAHHDTLGSV